MQKSFIRDAHNILSSTSSVVCARPGVRNSSSSSSQLARSAHLNYSCVYLSFVCSSAVCTQCIQVFHRLRYYYFIINIYS